MRWFVWFIFAAMPVMDAQAADWKATENIKYYSVSGTTGLALYKSIGENGPVISGNRRTIALTNWDLKWRRNYQPKGNACELVSALPFVTITYTLPKPSQKISGVAARKWQAFAQGIKAHEEVHGDYVKRLASDIINATVGLRVENDKACQKIRDEVLKRVGNEFARYKVDNRSFEQSEMREGGNIARLVLDLVN
ncbi:DUF922 domain-containing protein [Ahrensia marina]|uniref:Peptidase n=1 Tax=Ahrensia marina TaxID=1514904 RepID=A0A0M9GNY6_9HYPH|nr:DUF922 domain-containing protein [Ahrensia marina]KPB01966.1 hypothetical protein SU32_06335 [Ahrensia marina]